MIGDDHPVLRVTRQCVLVVGAGALGAAVCATAVRVAGVGGTDSATEPRARTVSASVAARPLRPTEVAAVALLRKAGAAELATGYSGKKLYASWSTEAAVSVLADVHHVPGRGTWLRVTSAGSDPDDPATGDQHLEQDDVDFDQHSLAMLTGQYTVRIASAEACIGRPVRVVEATPVHGGRVAGRFWIDDATGLVLRRELYDGAGRQVRATAFLDFTVARAGQPVAVPSSGVSTLAPPPSRPLDGPALAALRAKGWALPGTLPDGLALYRARSVSVQGGAATTGGQAVQLSYSDGLFSASVFVQRGRLDSSALSGFTRIQHGATPVWGRPGLYRHLVWSSRDLVYTLISDAPDATLQRILDGLPHTAPNTGLLDHVGRGIDRLGSWVNPFG